MVIGGEGFTQAIQGSRKNDQTVIRKEFVPEGFGDTGAAANSQGNDHQPAFYSDIVPALMYIMGIIQGNRMYDKKQNAACEEWVFPAWMKKKPTIHFITDKAGCKDEPYAYAADGPEGAYYTYKKSKV